MLNSRSHFINFLRWLSAILVLVSHIRSVLFVDFQDINTSSYFLKLFYLITSLGHEAVMVFFVISGYLVGGGIIESVKSLSFSLNQYAIKRITRLYMVLPIALLITILFDVWGAKLTFNGIYVHNENISSLGFNITERLTLKHFLNSLFMLQNVFCPPFGSNGPLWSLGYEFWYYIIGGLIGLLCLKIAHNKISSPILLFSLLTGVLALLPFIFIKYFMIWLFGAIVSTIDIKISKQYIYIYILLFLLVAFLLLNKSGIISISNPYYKDLIIGLLLAIILAVMPFRGTDRISIHYHLASFSYTLYLIHFPILLFTLSILDNYTGFGIKEFPNIRAFSCFIVFSVVLIYVSYLLALQTEAKTEHIREWIQCKLRHT